MNDRARRIDLHLHTTHSDGSLSPAAVLALAHQANVTALAITDHDITSGLPEAMKAGADYGIEVIPGIEISARYLDAELHILGYFLNWEDPLLNERLARLRASRHQRNPQIIQKLQDLGLAITYHEVEQLAGTESVGRPHIARVLMAKGYVSSAKEAFDRYLGNGSPAFVPRDLPDPTTAIRWIREAQGIPVLAHPTWAPATGAALIKLCEELKAAGLGGIEAYYSTHKPKQTAEYLQLAQRLDLLVTGGSDFHGFTKPDIDVGTGRGDLRVPEKLLGPLRHAAAVAG
ncbi:MAG: PHP domain-containing protein [Nitrospiraceae bacterium]